MRTFFILFLTLILSVQGLQAQELEARVTINHSQISNSSNPEIFDQLQQKMTSFLNERRWTDMQFRETERINCSFALIVNTYKEAENIFECALQLNVTRPVYGSTYTTTSYAIRDNDFNFEFQGSDQLEYGGPDRIDNNLVALLAYYAYMVIGYDMDSMAPLGGTQYFNIAEDIVATGENLGQTGWRAFGNSSNRFSLLNDYLDGSMECYRQLIYQYHRKGLDQMSTNVEAGREAIQEALQLLDEAHKARNMSMLPQAFTEYKKDELINIFSGKGSSADRETVYNILFGINASLNADWEKLK